jgi:hypothetical protein
VSHLPVYRSDTTGKLVAYDRQVEEAHEVADESCLVRPVAVD